MNNNDTAPQQTRIGDDTKTEMIKLKSDAVWLTFHELDGLLNISKVARLYFNRSHSWFAQKLHGYNVCSKERSFTSEEYSKISTTLRDIARKLNNYADIIDIAE